ncbi:MAG: Spy/CpxP family protein refolding chaperone, partial [Deltaproteobacteria bacterium]|nr:Spy/CpxP family protein refolding chaperone [Deltaproteobacteria bacterium]
MKKILAPRYLMLIILGISLCLPHAVYAFPNHHFTCPFKGIIMAVLGITDDQMASFDELKAETRAEIEPLAEEMMELGRQMSEILLAEEINTDEAKEKLVQIVDLKCQISSIGANAGLEGVQILTPEQRFTILIFVEDFLELLEWIADFPGWDKTKEHLEEYIKPILLNMLSKRLGIDLTDDQMDAFNELKAETRAEIEPLAEEMRELGRQIPEILLVEAINTVDAKEKLEQMVWLKCQISSTAANAKLKRAQILT